MKPIAAAVLALSLVAASCSDDSADTAPEPTQAPDTTAAPSETTAAPDDTVAPPDAVELFDSYQGVTAETIAFGVAAIDAEALIPFGVDLGTAPVEDMYTAWSDAQNARGGVLGRDLVPHTRLFLPVGAAPSDAVCAEFAEDLGVFAVVGQLLNDNPLCITELHGLPYIGHFGLTDEMDERSEGRFIATEMSPDDQRHGSVAAMIEQGDLDGTQVALWWDNPAEAHFADVVRPLLDDAGIAIVAEVEVGDFGQDQPAAQAAADQRMERVVSEGADFIVALGGIVPVTEAADRAGFSGTIGFTNGQAADQIVFPEADLRDPTTAERTFAITTDKPTPEEALADPGVTQCLEEYDAAYDEPIDVDSKTTLQALVNHCRAFRLMVMVFEAAGADLTPGTFATAAESLGTFVLPAMSEATLSPESRSAGSLIRRYEYDPAVGYHLPVGEPFLPDTPA